MFKDIDAVLFDFDGTMVNSMSVWEDIDEEFFRENNFDVNYQDLKKDIEGCSMRETAIYFIENFNLESTPEQLMDEWCQMALEHYENTIDEKAGLIDFVKALKNKGIKIAVGSSNTRELIDAGLKAHDIYDDIDYIVTAHDVNASKPDPAVYLKGAELLGVDPKKCIVFEDVFAGLQAGKNAGMKTCVIFDDYSSFDWDEKKAYADYFINDYREVIGLLNE